MKPTPAHARFRDDAIVLLRRHAGDLNAVEMLACAAHLVGQIVALQDSTKITRQHVLQIIGLNVEAGSQEAAAARSPIVVPT